jgi:flavin-binding protein dodecin
MYHIVPYERSEYPCYYKRNIIRSMSVAKIVQLVGSYEKGWEDAAQTAVKGATKSIRGIHGIEVKDITAKIDSKTGKIRHYMVGIKLSFGIER